MLLKCLAALSWLHLLQQAGYWLDLQPAVHCTLACCCTECRAPTTRCRALRRPRQELPPHIHTAALTGCIPCSPYTPPQGSELARQTLCCQHRQ